MSDDHRIEYLLEKVNIILNNSTLSIDDRNHLIDQAIQQFHSLPAISERLDHKAIDESSEVIMAEKLDTKIIEKMAIALGYRRSKRTTKPRMLRFLQYLEKEVR